MVDERLPVKGTYTMKKVLILANSDRGLLNFRAELLEQLRDQYEVTAVVPKINLPEQFAKMNCKAIEAPLSRRSINPLQDIRLCMKYVRLIRDIKPDCILTYTIKPNVYGGFAASLCKRPVIANITGLGTAVEQPGVLQFVTTWLYRIGLRRSACVMFQNTANEKFFAEHKLLGKRTRTHQLNGSGVNLNRFTYCDYPETEEVNFLFVSRLLKEKGIDLYLEAADRIHEKHSNVKFHICGNYDDPKYKAILEDDRRSRYVIYHGRQSNMKDFYSMASCVVHPSYYPEGMSNVLQEAAATGRPVITTDRSGCREVVEAGRTGYLISEKDAASHNVSALVDAIERFLQLSHEERAEMGRAGRAKMEKEFNRQKVVDTYLREIEGLVK